MSRSNKIPLFTHRRLHRNKTVCLIWIKSTQVEPERPEGKVTLRPLIFMEKHGCHSGTNTFHFLLHVFLVVRVLWDRRPGSTP